MGNARIEESQSPLVSIYDQGGHLVSMSRTFMDYFRVIPDDVLGHTPPYPWHPEEGGEALRALFDAAVSKAGSRFEGIKALARMRSPNGSIDSLVITPRKLPDGTTAFFAKPQEDLELVRKAIDLGRFAKHLQSGQSGLRLDLAELSLRERTIVERLIRGDRVAEIAEELHISVHTVRNHRKSIYSKLGVRSQVELVSKFGMETVD